MKKLTYAMITSILLLGCGEDRNTLYLFTWSDYMDQAVIDDFEREYGCKVSITTFDSNESAYAKLKSGATGYDVMIPSSYMVSLLAEENIIESIDLSRIPTVLSNFCHRFDAQIHDEGMMYSVPYMATYTGLVYDRKSVDFGDDPSWTFLSTTDMKFSLLDDMREVIGLGLMVNGFSINSENEDEIAKATETILGMKKGVRKFDSESYKTEIPNRSFRLGHGYSSDAFQVIIGEDEASRRDDIGFALPKEGFVIAFDEFVVMRDSGNRDLAYKFIDFMYRPENSLRNMLYTLTPTPNEKAIGDLPEKFRNMIILDDETLKRGQVIRRFRKPETQELYNRAWDEIRSLDKGK